MPVPAPAAITNADPQFYVLLGPFLANRAVHKALGGVPWDDDTKTWLLLLDGNGEVVAFCGVTQGGRRTRTVLESLYVVPGHDQHDAAAQSLLRCVAEQFGNDQDLHTVVRNELVTVHQAAGFAILSEMTNFTKLVRPADIRART